MYFVPVIVTNNRFVETLLSERILSFLKEFEQIQIIVFNAQPCARIVHTVFKSIENNTSLTITSNDNISSYVFFINNSIHIKIIEQNDETDENDISTESLTEVLTESLTETETTGATKDKETTVTELETSTTTPKESTAPSVTPSTAPSTTSLLPQQHTSKSSHSSQEQEYTIISPPNESPQYSKEQVEDFLDLQTQNLTFSPTTSHSDDNEMFFGTTTDHSALLQIARAVLYNSMSQMKWIQDKRVHRGGVFVTLRKGTQLRGCVGHTVSRQSIVDEVIQLTKAAYNNDSRFDNSKTSPTSLRITVSILSPLHRIQSLKQFKEGVHGLFIKNKSTQKEAVYLPEVFIENGFKSKTEYLKSLCEKARINPNNCDERDLKIYVFTSQIFAEK